MIILEVGDSNAPITTNIIIMSVKTCPCGDRTSPDSSCDMCDGWTNDPDTGWGGFTDGYIGIHFDSKEDRDKHIDIFGYEYESDEDYEDEDSW